MKRALPFTIALLFAFACRTTSPDAEFAKLESRLLATPELDMTFQLQSKGAVESASTGKLEMRERDVLIQAETTIGGNKTTRSHALTDHGAQVSQRRLLVLGMMRMGLLHNMVMLASGKPIMHDVERSVRVKNVRWNAQDESFAFDVFVDGAKTAEGQLWLDRSGRPKRRVQTVHFPNGDMQVEEQYAWF